MTELPPSTPGAKKPEAMAGALHGGDVVWSIPGIVGAYDRRDSFT